MTYGPIAYEDLSLLNAQWSQARPAMAGLGSTWGQHEYRDLSYLNARLRPGMPAQVGMGPDGMGGGSLGGNSLGIMVDGEERPGGVVVDEYGLAIPSANRSSPTPSDDISHDYTPPDYVPGYVAPTTNTASTGLALKSPDSRVSELQGLLNRVLTANGYNTLGTPDGKLGKGTCGAIDWYLTTGHSLASASTAQQIQANLAYTGALYDAACAGKSPWTSPSKRSTASTTTTDTTTNKKPSTASVLGGGGGTNWMLYGGAVAAILVGGALVYRASKKK
jgi:hypothetical protein